MPPPALNRARRRVVAALFAGTLGARTLNAAPMHSSSNPVESHASQTEPADALRATLRDGRGTKLVLLGVGGDPLVGIPRRQTSQVLLHGRSAYMVDFGLGVTDALARTGIPFEKLRAGFITRHHPDHNVEYGPFLLLGWIYGMPPVFHAYGPPPLEQMTRDYLRSQLATTERWADNAGLAPLTSVPTTEIIEPGFVMSDDDVRVSAALIGHPGAYAYRFDFEDRSIAFSGGGTVRASTVAQFARGADVLVHEVMSLAAAMQLARTVASRDSRTSYDRVMRFLLSDHSTAEEAGRVAAQADVKTLVLSHLSPVMPEMTATQWHAAAARYFKGEIIVGQDLMVV